MVRSPVLIALLLSGCATTGVSSRLETGFVVASQRAQLAEAGVQDLQDRITEMEAALREQGMDRASGMATVQEIRAEVARLRGAVEELGFSLTELRADFDTIQMDRERRDLHAEARLTQLEALLGVTPPPPPRLGLPEDGEAVSATGTPAGTVPGVSDSVVEATDFESRLALAESRMEEGQQAAARAILEMAVQAEPGHPRATEAKYRAAETYFNEGKWREAARQFQAVSDADARSPFTPWAMLRIGECFDAMGRPDAAVTFYEGVDRKFPGTDAAKEAKRLLAR